MFTNRHVVVALLVTPLLAVLAWFAVGHWFEEVAQPAEAGRAYPLVAQSNCRYESGQCDLRNGDMRLALTVAQSASVLQLSLNAEHRLESAHIGVAHEQGEAAQDQSVAPQALQRVTADGRLWRIQLEEQSVNARQLFVVVSANGTRWYGQTSTAFLGQ